MSNVKNIKFVLKGGKARPSKSEVKFWVKSKIPSLDNINPLDYARNSAAISTNGKTCAEGNSVGVTFVKYIVDGIVFKDTDKDGVKNETEDVVTSGMKVELIDASTNEVAKDIRNDQTLVTTTDSKDKYHFDVYKRGKYKVRLTKSSNDTYTTAHGKNTMKTVLKM